MFKRNISLLPTNSKMYNTHKRINSSRCTGTGSGSDSGESGHHPSYKGVRQRGNGKWVSEIREPKTPNRIWLGSFPTPEMAAVAYDVAALALKGHDTQLNFPNLASSLPVPASNSPRDIQAAAASAAASAGEDADFYAINHQIIPGEISTPSGDFMDEDLIFDMPNILVNMAQGMLISPPRLDVFEDNTHHSCPGDQNLWNYPY